MRTQRVKPCSESLAPSPSHVDLAELIPLMSPELIETGPARHQALCWHLLKWASSLHHISDSGLSSH